MDKIRNYACNGDIVELKVYTIGTAPVQIAQGRPARRAIVFSASGNEAVTVGLTSSVAAAGGLQVAINVEPLCFERGQYAPFVASALWAVAAAPGGTLSVLEIVDEPNSN